MVKRVLYLSHPRHHTQRRHAASPLPTTASGCVTDAFLKESPSTSSLNFWSCLICLHFDGHPSVRACHYCSLAAVCPDDSTLVAF